MGDGSLSQEEIDALLTGVDEGGIPPAGGGGSTSTIAIPPQAGGQYPVVLSALTEAMSTASSSMTTLVGKNIKFTNPTSSMLNADNIADQLVAQSVIISTKIGDITTLLSLESHQAGKIAMNIMGSTDAPGELNDAHLSSINELCGTIISAMTTKIGQKFSEDLAASTPEVKIFTNRTDLPKMHSPNVMQISFGMNMDDVSLGNFVVFIDESGPIRWSQKERGGMSDINFDVGGVPQMGDDPMQGLTANAAGVGGGSQTMSPVSFPTFQTGTGSQADVSPNYELLLDVQMVLTVELGRTTKYVKDVLKLGEGSIIELDKLAGEPVDLLINGKLIAKGEVVVIDENFGVRVTDIVAPAERLAKISAS